MFVIQKSNIYEIYRNCFSRTHGRFTGRQRSPFMEAPQGDQRLLAQHLGRSKLDFCILLHDIHSAHMAGDDHGRRSLLRARTHIHTDTYSDDLLPLSS